MKLSWKGRGFRGYPANTVPVSLILEWQTFEWGTRYVIHGRDNREVLAMSITHNPGHFLLTEWHNRGKVGNNPGGRT